MDALFTILGFTTPQSTLWNLAAYVAFIAIIVGVLYGPLRDLLVTAGAAILAAYSALFLHNQVFAALQTVITVAGVLQILGTRRYISVIVILALAIAAQAFLGDYLTPTHSAIGNLGLFGISMGLLFTPRSIGFAIMTIGAVLLVLYAWSVGAWVFFWLNIFFALANVKNLIWPEKAT